MAGALNLVYAGAALLVAILGVAYVLLQTPAPAGEETKWSDWSLIAAVAIFLVVMVWSVAA